MSAVGFFCKSFGADFGHLAVLLESFEQHNPDNLPLVLSLPRKDMASFHNCFGNAQANLRLVADEDYTGHDLSALAGWHGQQVCKLTSWRATELDHYVVLDSDTYFIGDVRRVDLLPSEGKRFQAYGSSIRTVYKADDIDLLRYIRGELVPNASHFPAPPEGRIDRLDDYLYYLQPGADIPSAVERSDVPYRTFGSKRWLYYQPGQIFSAGILMSFREYLTSHGLTEVQAIQICPWEYNWYGEYAANFCHNDTQFRVSSVVHFQSDEDVAEARANGVTERSLARTFGFIQMAARHVAELRL